MTEKTLLEEEEQELRIMTRLKDKFERLLVVLSQGAAEEEDIRRSLLQVRRACKVLRGVNLRQIQLLKTVALQSDMIRQNDILDAIEETIKYVEAPIGVANVSLMEELVDKIKAYIAISDSILARLAVPLRRAA